MFFDFDGVLVDSEPIHFEAFRHVLASAGVDLPRRDYYQKYLGYDDRAAFLAIGRDRGRPFSDSQLAELSATKTLLVQKRLGESATAMPGAVELITAGAAAAVPMAICSGALRAEIELPCRRLGILEHFAVIVSAEDVPDSKPSPQGYLMACRLLGRRVGRTLRPARCLVIEDSPFGIQAGKAAGMKVLAAATSYRPEDLREADKVVGSLAEVTPADLEALL